MNLIDALIIMSLLFTLFRGYRKGIAVSFFKLLGYLCGLVTGLLFSEVLAKTLNRSLGLTEKLMPWLGEKAILPAAVTNTSIESIPFDKVQGTLEAMPLPEFFQIALTDYFSEIEKLPDLGITKLGDGLIYIISNFIVVGICFFILYWVVSHFLGVTIPRWFRKASPGPITLIDRMGGACLGLLSGLIGIAITIGMMMPIVAAGSLQGPGNQGALAKLAVIFSESKIALFISDIIMGIIR